MNSVRVTSLCLVVAFVFVPLPAQAQNPDLEARVAALEARVAKLESGQVDAADLVGTYVQQIFGVELLGDPARIGVETSAARLTLNADGTGSATGVGGRCGLQEAVPWVLTCGEEHGAGTFSWFVRDGMIVIVDEDGENTAPIGAGGRVLIFGGTAGAGWSNLGIVIRLPTSQEPGTLR